MSESQTGLGIGQTHPLACKCLSCTYIASRSMQQTNVFCVHCNNAPCQCAKIPNVIAKPRSPLPLTDAERKALPVLTFLCEYFPDAIVELTKLCVAGNVQHNPELAPTDIKWSREKSADQLNTAFRHLFERKCGVVKDTDGQFHAIKAMWRCGAQAQLDIEESRK